jgi:hypothetical protein
MLWAHNQPHQTCDPTGQSETMPACPKAALTADQTAATVAKYESLVQSAMSQDQGGQLTASHATVQKMRDDWDADATALQAVNNTTWTLLDHQMDAVLKAYAIDHGNIPPASPTQQAAELQTLLTDLQQHKF